MAFEDRPQIDENAINDKRAQQKLLSMLSEEYNFRPRGQVPDNGSDYRVELIIDGGATHWEFPVQLKSIVNPTFIANNTFISYNFPTSRLSYLLNNIPQVGIIVLYHVGEDRLYFDHITSLYNRLLEERGNEDWKANESVSLHFPTSQELIEERLQELHAHFIQVYENVAMMHQSFGGRYNLNYIQTKTSINLDLQNPEVIKRYLKKFGHLLVTQNETLMVSDLLDRLAERDINEDKDLLLLKAMIASQIGRAIDSMRLIKRCRNRFQLSDEEQFTVKYLELRNELSTADIDSSTFLNECKQLLQQAKDTNNQLLLRINIMYYSLASLKFHQKVPDDILNELEDIGNNIDSLTDESTKYQLMLWHTDNVGLVVDHETNLAFSIYQVRESMGIPFTLVERKGHVIATMNLQMLFTTAVQKIREYAIFREDQLLRAFCDALDLRFRLAFEYSALKMLKDRVLEVGARNVHAARVQNACVAADVFSSNLLLKDAHNTVINILDYLYIFEHVYGVTFPEVPLATIQNNRQYLEQELEIEEHTSNIAPGLVDLANSHDANRLPALTTEQIDWYANVIIQSGRYPMAEKRYIIQELEGIQLFNQRCKDKSVQLLVKNHSGAHNKYTVPVTFVLKRVESGIESTPDTNLDRLLTSWGY